MVISEAYNVDNKAYMRSLPDNFFDIAVVDPPYGLDFTKYKRVNNKKSKALKERYSEHNESKWDTGIPDNEYFDLLFRISKNQIIWGGNYFDLPPTQCFIFWDKKQPVNNFADGELAWTSFKRPAKCFRYPYYGNINSELDRIHITQKPVKLYDWIFKNFVLNDFNESKKQGLEYRIFDSHLGSGSSRISAYSFGIDFYSTEKDKEIFDRQEERFLRFKSQNSIFLPDKKIVEKPVFLFDDPEPDFDLD